MFARQRFVFKLLNAVLKVLKRLLLYNYQCNKGSSVTNICIKLFYLDIPRVKAITKTRKIHKIHFSIPKSENLTNEKKNPMKKISTNRRILRKDHESAECHIL
jgi:hypothetical protein